MTGADLLRANPADFDPKSPTFDDDWDCREVILDSFEQLDLPHAIESALAEQRVLHEKFNTWINRNATGPGAAEEEAWGKASVLESLSCKALLEWLRGAVHPDAPMLALEKCSEFYVETLVSS